MTQSLTYIRVLDVDHGFAAALGDFEDEHNRKRVDDAIQLTVKFFNDCFNDKKSN
jgi:hypothetical protein